ncbi:right-handed parallel beta-helix repeat-containing protein [Candidatus Bipolaricaulota bacterium]
MKAILVAVAILLVVGQLALAREIHVPLDVQLSGSVLIAEVFGEYNGDKWIPIEFPAWPGERGWRASSWFNVLIEAHPGDILILAPGAYEAQLWIFTPQITVMTDPESAELAVIQGTVEIDADRVTLERISVTNSSLAGDSGHGIEVNGDLLDYVTIRECHSSENRWTGIHMIGVRGRIVEMRVEDCELIDNGMDGMDSKNMEHLIVTGCTVTGNGWDLANGVGIRIGSNVQMVELENNIVENNRSEDVYRKE